MSQRLPSLHLLRIFEVAARKNSFKLAAEELHLTPSAVSHQVKSLEQQIGFKLFVRHNRRIDLTPAGRALQAEVSEAFLRLETGVRRVSAQHGRPALRVTTVAAFASNYLIPRLGRFQARFPELELRIETSFEPVDLRFDDVDLALRIGKGSWDGLRSEKLFDLYITPVCSEAFASEHRLTSIAQLNQVPLIGLPNIGDIWADWASTVGAELDTRRASVAFSTYEASIMAARQGLGVALAILPIEQPALDAGGLVAPFANCCYHWQNDFHAVYTADQGDREVVRSFIDWVGEEVRSGVFSLELHSSDR